MALDCLLPGPPSVTVSSHGHRRLASPQDRGPGHLPRPWPFCPQESLIPRLAVRAAAVRGADPRQALPSGGPVPVPQGLRGATGPHGHRTTQEQSSAWSPPCAPPPTPPPLLRRLDVVSLTGAEAVLSAMRVPPPRLQGNRGFRLLLWEPEVTVYSHGRPAARPRAAPRLALPAGDGGDHEQEEVGAASQDSACLCRWGQEVPRKQPGLLPRLTDAFLGGRRCTVYGVCLTVGLTDCPILLAEVLQPGDSERRGSYEIWVLFISSMGGMLLGLGGKIKCFCLLGTEGSRQPYSSRTLS